MKFHDGLSQLSWQDFEVLLANYYREQGYDVIHCGNGTLGVRGSGGVDLRMRLGDRLVLVQCRHGSILPVDAAAIERLLAIRDEDGAAEAIVVTSGEFSADARRAAEAGAITLVDGVQLREMLGGDRLEKLPPPRVAPPQSQSRIVVKDLSPPSRRHRKGGSMLLKLLLVLALIGLLAWQAPALRALLGRPAAAPAAPSPAAGNADGTESVTVPLPGGKTK
jgi:hypothetical protein